MFAVLSSKSLERVRDLVDFAESAEATPGSIWENREFRERFADTTDNEFRVASALLRERLAEREHVDGLRVQMAKCVANVVRIQGDLLKTTTSVIEETAKWLASDPPAMRGKQKGNAA